MFRTIVLTAVVILIAATGVRSEEVQVGTYAEFPPFEYTDDANNIIGFDIDVIEAIGRVEGFTPVWTSQAFAALIEGLEGGRTDIVASGLTITEARQLKVDFSDPYFEVALVVVVREGDKLIENLEELRDKEISVLMGSTASVVLEKAFGENNPKVRHLSKYNEIFNDLVTNRADAILVDEPMAKAYTARMGGMVAGKARMHLEEYGFAVRKGNKALLDRVNSGLRKIGESGEFQAITEKWFKDE